MPRPPAATSIDAIIRDALDGVVKSASVAIAKAVADLAAAELSTQLAQGVARAGGSASAGRGRRPPAAGRRPARARGEITRWAADRRARRVPNFVIDMTGLKTKRQIVAKYGDGVVFEKGKAAPKTR